VGVFQCPRCKRRGLRRMDKNVILSQDEEHYKKNGMWCPHCKEWVTSISGDTRKN
jgi:uncharacterized protein YbaR (Trm112 family)